MQYDCCCNWQLIILCWCDWTTSLLVNSLVSSSSILQAPSFVTGEVSNYTVWRVHNIVQLWRWRAVCKPTALCANPLHDMGITTSEVWDHCQPCRSAWLLYKPTCILLISKFCKKFPTYTRVYMVATFKVNLLPMPIRNGLREELSTVS